MVLLLIILKNANKRHNDVDVAREERLGKCWTRLHSVIELNDVHDTAIDSLHPDSLAVRGRQSNKWFNHPLPESPVQKRCVRCFPDYTLQRMFSDALPWIHSPYDSVKKSGDPMQAIATSDVLGTKPYVESRMGYNTENGAAITTYGH